MMRVHLPAHGLCRNRGVIIGDHHDREFVWDSPVNDHEYSDR
jgi:hypothetical protein